MHVPNQIKSKLKSLVWLQRTKREKVLPYGPDLAPGTFSFVQSNYQIIQLLNIPNIYIVLIFSLCVFQVSQQFSIWLSCNGEQHTNRCIDLQCCRIVKSNVCSHTAQKEAGKNYIINTVAEEGLPTLF